MSGIENFMRENADLLLRLFVWFLNGLVASVLLIGLGNFVFLQYVQLHPLRALKSKSASRFSMDGPADPKNWTKVDELYLVKSSQSKKGQGEDGSGPSFKDIQLDSVEKIEESSLPLEVVGITYGPPSLRSVTLRNLKSRNLHSLLEGESWSGAKIKEIRQNEVLIRNKKSGKPEILRLTRGYENLTGSSNKSDKTDSDKSKSISRYQVNEAIQYNMNNLLEAVKVTPAFDRGEIIGLKLGKFEGRPGDLLKRLGFKPGDIITRVNGQKIDDIDQALQLWSQLRHQKNFKVQVLRNGATKTFEYELTR